MGDSCAKSLGRSGPLRVNTEKLELPSISQVQTRGPAETPWFSSHYSSRPLLSGDRLPNLNLPQSYIATPGYSYSRTGGPDYLLSGSSSYPRQSSGIGLKTPLPSPTSQCSVPSTHDSTSDTVEHLDYAQRDQEVPAQSRNTDNFPNAMNQQQQYLGSEHSHLSTGQSYQPQPTTAGGMSQYSSYQQQPPVLQPGPTNYAPAPAHYGQYGYSNGLASPQSAGHPVSSSMGTLMNSGLLPPPSKSRAVQPLRTRLADMNSDGRWTTTTHVCWSANGTSSRLPTAERRHKWSSRSFRYETSSDGNTMGGRRMHVLPSGSQRSLCCEARR